MNHGRALRKIRTAKGLSLKQIGDAMGVSKSRVASLEGDATLTPDTLKRAADALGVKPSQLAALAFEPGDIAALPWEKREPFLAFLALTATNIFAGIRLGAFEQITISRPKGHQRK